MVGEHPDGLELRRGWSMWASSMARIGVRPRSACSLAMASRAWGTRVAWWVRGHAAEGGDDGVVDAADADGRGWAGRSACGGTGRVRSNAARRATVLPAPTSPVTHAEGALLDAPGDAGGGLVVGVVAVQHAGGEFAAERHAGEAVVGLQIGDHRDVLCG